MPQDQITEHTVAAKVKLVVTKEIERELLLWCDLYKDCLVRGTENVLAAKEAEDNSATASLARIVMLPSIPSHLKDAASQEIAANWRSYIGLWKNKKRGLPTVTDKPRCCARDRAVEVLPDCRLRVQLRKDHVIECEFRCGERQKIVLERAVKIGEVEIFRRKSKWFAAIACRLPTIKTKKGVGRSLVTIHTGQRKLISVLVVYADNSYRYLTVRGQSYWNLKRKWRNLRKALGEKKKLQKIKQIGARERRFASWITHTVSAQVCDWIWLAVDGTNPVITVGRHNRVRDKFKKGKSPPERARNYRMANYCFAKLLDELQYKMALAGLPFKVVDDYKVGVTRNCCRCGGPTQVINASHSVKCDKCGRSHWAEWNALKNLLPKSRRKITRKPGKVLEKKVGELNAIESRLRNRLLAVGQRREQ